MADVTILMKNIVPRIFRERLLIEGFYTINVNKKTIEDYFSFITKKLKLKAYGPPIIHETGGKGKKTTQGYLRFIENTRFLIV